MTATAYPGPLSVVGLNPPMVGPVPYIGGQPALGVPENPDFGPSLLWMGIGIRDPRYLAQIGQGANVAGGYPNQDAGWLFAGPGILCCDFAPSTISATNIVTSQVHTVSGTPITLNGASTGITVAPAGGVYVLGSMQTIPKGALIIDGNPGYTGSGQSGGFQFWNPAHGASRGISVTGTSGAAVAFKINGYDLYGFPQTETLTASGASTVSTKKTYKAIGSIVPGSTDNSHTYTFGTADLFGFAIAVREWPMVEVWYGDPTANPPTNDLISGATGFTVADNTTPGLTTGDVRGTYALQTPSNGTLKLTIFAALPFGVIASSYASAVVGLLGQTPA